MSWEDENIDKLFRETSENLSFDFKEEYWDEMEAMLPKKKRKFPFIWFFTSLLVCVFLASTFLLKPLTRDDKKIKAPATVLTQYHPNKQVKEGNNLHRIEKKNQNQVSSTIVNSKTPVKKERKLGSSENFSTSLFTAINRSEFTERKTIIHQEMIDTNTAVPIINTESKDLNEPISAISNLRFPSTPFLHSLVLNPPISTHFSRWHLYFDASTAMGQSLVESNSAGSSISKGFGLGTGIMYSTKLWSFSSGLAVSFKSFDNLCINERVKIYGFGVQNFEKEIEYNQLYSLEVPLMTSIKQKNHIVQFGIVPSFLLGSKISYENRTNDVVTASSTLFGYRKGLTNFGLKPTIGYLFKISNSLQIGANVQVQLFSPLQDELFLGVKNKMPVNGQIYIRKSIFLK